MNIITIARHPVTFDGETAQIGTAGELAIALDVLQGNHDREVLEQLRPHLADIVAGPQGLFAVLRSLSRDDQIFLLDAIGPRLADVVQEPRYLRDIFATMAHAEVEEKLLNTLGSAGLQQLILTAEELAEVMEWLYGQCDQLALDLLGPDYLRGLFHDGDELALVLRALDNARQKYLLDVIGWERVAALVDEGRDLAQPLRALPPDASQRLLSHYSRDRLVQLIGN